MTTNHTPPPWRAHNIGGLPNGPYTFPLGTNPDNAAANAELLVRAVNAHDELVAALEDVLASVDHMVRRLDAEPGNQTLVSCWQHRLAPARAALAKATGEAKSHA